MKSYLTFSEAGGIRFPEANDPRRKTKIWLVTNDGGDELGIIRWFSSWRQYCYYQHPDITMSMGCLQEIVNFINVEMQKRRVS